LEEFEDYLKKVDAEKNLVTADADLVRSWMVYLMEKGRSVATVNRKLSSLRSFYRFLLRRRVVDLDPMLKVVGPKKQKTLPSFLRVQEMDRLLDECSVNEGFEGVRDRLILEMFYATGMRLSELIGLSDADVDLSAKLLKVTGKRNKQRLIPFGEELWMDLLGYIKLRNETLPDRDDALFVRKDGKRMYPELVYKIVRRNLSKVATLKKRSPHVLRHTFATAMMNGNAELQAVKELLGHESLATTEIYTHTTFEELKKVYEQAHPRA
jgi:integrase/recombinase XerC